MAANLLSPNVDAWIRAGWICSVFYTVPGEGAPFYTARLVAELVPPPYSFDGGTALDAMTILANALPLTAVPPAPPP